MNELVSFAFTDKLPVRVVVDELGNPWFVAADVAAVLQYSDAHAMTRHLDGDETCTVKLTDQVQMREYIVISESGLYTAIVRSNKPEAVLFRKWVTGEVLPSIRKTGGYGKVKQEQTAPVLPNSQEDKLRTLLLMRKHLASIPGVRKGILESATLRTAERWIGLPSEELRLALPPVKDNVHTHNPTKIGKLMGMTGAQANQWLYAAGLQRPSNGRDAWELTEKGKQWAESIPYTKNGHSGYQILWNPAVAEYLKR